MLLPSYCASTKAMKSLLSRPPCFPAPSSPTLSASLPWGTRTTPNKTNPTKSWKCQSPTRSFRICLCRVLLCFALFAPLKFCTFLICWNRKGSALSWSRVGSSYASSISYFAFHPGTYWAPLKTCSNTPSLRIQLWSANLSAIQKCTAALQVSATPQEPEGSHLRRLVKVQF